MVLSIFCTEGHLTRGMQILEKYVVMTMVHLLIIIKFGNRHILIENALFFCIPLGAGMQIISDFVVSCQGDN